MSEVFNLEAHSNGALKIMQWLRDAVELVVEKPDQVEIVMRSQTAVPAQAWC